MLFNSLPFLLIFAPLVISGYWSLANRENLRLWFLIAASITFYGYWNVRDVPLLLLSVGANWLAAGLFAGNKRRSIVILAVVGNLAILAFYKYLAFFVTILNQTTGTDYHVSSVSLPLGISFFTFHHIIYWVDLWRGHAPFYRLRDYALYIVNFPQLLAGPLVRNREIVPQFSLSPWREGWEERLGRGVILFSIGLAKKVFFADSLASSSTEMFAKANQASVSFLEAWNGCLSFAFQIYFDFSGYSDMAIGLALMLGMALPVNFDKPYNAVNLREFWRRWHMTLSFFLRDYLYIPLGGGRQGPVRQLFALMTTMVLGGLWHGAGWTFVLWGLLHGFGLVACVLWQRWFPPMPAVLGWALTLLFVFIGWVLFRANSLEAAWSMFRGMFGATGLGHFGPWRTLMIGAAVALFGSSSMVAAARILPRKILAVALALVVVTSLFKIGGGEYEFIYFQF